MRNLFIGLVGGAVMLGAAWISGGPSAQAQEPPILILPPPLLCNLLQNEPCPPFVVVPSDPPVEPDNGAAPGDPNPILVFVIGVIYGPQPEIVHQHGPGSTDMNQSYCEVAYPLGTC